MGLSNSVQPTEKKKITAQSLLEEELVFFLHFLPCLPLCLFTGLQSPWVRKPGWEHGRQRSRESAFSKRSAGAAWSSRRRR